MPPIDKLLSQYSAPVRSWPGEEWMDEEARANYAAANPPKLQTEGGSIDKGDLLPIVRYPTENKSPSEWTSSSDVMKQLDDGWRVEPFSRLTAPFKSMAEAWRTQPVLGPMVRPSQMRPEVLDQMSSDAMTVAGTGMTGGIGRAAVAPHAPSGTFDLGMFGGRRGAEELARKGEPRPLQALNMLEQMEKAGASREEIWAATGKILKDSPYAGAFRGVDQQPRFEIDDSSATLRDGPASKAMLDGMNTERRRLLNAVKESVQAEKVQPDFFPKDVKAVRSDLRSQAAALKEKANENYGLTWHPAMGRRAEYAFDHDPVLSGYPEIARGVIVRRGASGEPGVRGSFDADSKSLDIYGAATDPLSVGLHELQHAVQRQEGTATGGNPGQFERTPVPGTAVDTSAIDDLIQSVGFKRPDDTIDARSYLNALFDQVKSHPSSTPDAMLRIADEMKRIDKMSLSPMEQYRRLAGETEARTVQARQNMSAEERRASPPWTHYDVPESDQIVRFGSGEGAMTNKPLDMSPEARLARAREMGFDTERKWYHGTRSPEAFPAFELGRPTHNNLGFLGNVETNRHAAFFSDNPEVSGAYGTNVGEYYLRGDPVDLAQIEDAFVDSLDAFGDRDVWMRAKHGREPWRFFDGELGERFRQWAKDNNIEAVRFSEAIENSAGKEFEGTTVAVLDPANIRSTNADFAPDLSSSPNLMASIDPLSMAMGSAPPRSIDPLGYYSPTLEAALKLSQNKGTPEQMLAQLKKAGAKDSEIEVSGLKKMFEGKKAVTKDEIVKALEDGKVGLKEKVYAQAADDLDDVALDMFGNTYDSITAAQQRKVAEAAGVDPNKSYGEVRYADYSLDPQNPTYREVVLHLPETGMRPSANGYWEVTTGRGRPEVFADEASARARVAETGGEARPQMVKSVGDDFRSGHFDEPNIVGHMMVSETRLPLDVGYPPGRLDEIGQRIMTSVGARNVKDLGSGAMDTAVKRGAVTPDEASAWSFHHFGNRLGRDPRPRVLTLDQVQSDWGQKLRDGGVRDEGKVAELKARIAEIDPILKEAHEAYKAGLSEYPDSIGTENIQKLSQGLFGRPYEQLSGEQRLELASVASENNKKITVLERARKDLQSKRALLEAELRTAEAATPGHPLVNTTDQWLNTTLRRAIRMAAEEGQDYIAIPSGNTVLGYNPGQEKGMLGFYGGLPEEMGDVVSTLRQAASKSPNEPVINTLSPQTIDALAEAGILDKKKIEGISTARVLKQAESRFQGIVPKNLGALLQKLDKNTPPPQIIDTLDSPSGATGLGQGFTLFRITPEAKKAATEGGQPLFRWGGRVTR